MALFGKAEQLLIRLNDLVEKIAINLSWVLLFFITALNIIQVFYRYVLNDALSWTEEASLWMLVWISFAILPVAYRQGLNISMMFFRDLLKIKRIEFIIRCFFHLLVILIALVCFDQAWQMYKGGHRLEMPALEISKAWVYIVMPPAWICLILVVIEGLLMDGRRAIDPTLADRSETLKKSDFQATGDCI